MKIKDDIRPISYIKTNAAGILNQVNDTHRPVYITQNGEAKAVLMDTESYESMQKAVGILKLVAMGEKDIKEGKISEQSEFFSTVEKTYFRNRK